MRRNLSSSGFAFVALAFLASACGSGNSSNKPGVAGVPGSTTPGVNNGNGQIVTGQCAPITGLIPFVGEGIYRDSANIVGGKLPFTGQAAGAMGITGGNGYFGGGLQWQQMGQWGFQGGAYGRSGSDGTISIQETNPQQYGGQPYPGYPYQTGGYNPNPYGNNQYYGQQIYGHYPSQWQTKTVNVQGSLQLSYLVIQDIMQRFAGGGGMPTVQNGYPNYYGQNGGNFWMPQPGQQQVCVSGIAMNVGHYHTTVYGGQVYLYLNGTEHGYILYF